MTSSRAADAFEELASFLEANGKGHWVRRGTPADDAPSPLWAHLIPASLRAFVARCGYPSLLAPRVRIAFVPLRLQPALGLAEPGFTWNLYKALLQSAVRRANGAFFAGADFSEVGGWCLRHDGTGERVWRVEDGLVFPQEDEGSFEEWFVMQLESVRRAASKKTVTDAPTQKRKARPASDPAADLRMYEEFVPAYAVAVTPDVRWPNGTTQSEGAFREDKPEGFFRFFYETGAPLASGHFVNGVRQGPWQYHLPPSHTEDASEKRLWGRGEVKDGLEEGPWVGSNEWSPVELTRVFRAGVLDVPEVLGSVARKE
ncbi:hypothetical protein DRW03_03440 [Corallococcus sp. H22C18031201]|nr:hypothetical protein DRW03_03440 [Corallococcus sp. H22C18031201]